MTSTAREPDARGTMTSTPGDPNMILRMDTVSQQTRSRIMRSIRSSGTGPEVAARSLLHRCGCRFRLATGRALPGKPDVVLPSRNVAVFVHGCFWHRCHCMTSTPEANREFWSAKFERNQARDVRAVRSLRRLGWRVLVLWECALAGRRRLDPDMLATAVVGWLASGGTFRSFASRRGRGLASARRRRATRRPPS